MKRPRHPITSRSIRRKNLNRFLIELGSRKRFSFDTETDALGAMRSNLVGMSFSWEAGKGYYLPVKGPPGCVHLDRAHVVDRVKADSGKPGNREGRAQYQI